MTIALWISIIVAIVPAMLALTATIFSIRNGRKIQEIHLNLNSRLTQLISASISQGRIDERGDRALKDLTTLEEADKARLLLKDK